MYLQVCEQLRGNPGQWKAYESAGNCVILAGPGSGKTKTLTIKLARMFHEDVHSPRGIACITYNNQCARELKRRLTTLGIRDGDRVSIGTLHSFCLRHIVSPYAGLASLPISLPITLATTEETEKLQEKALGSVIGNERWGPRFDKYRRDILDRDSAEWHEKDEQAAEVIEKYESLLQKKGLLDFDSLVLTGLKLVQDFPWVRKALRARFPILVVDEYQDLGTALDRIVKCLCFDGGMRLLAVGDPDQSIYGFTGANPSLLKDLAERSDVEKVRLNLNYRCGSAIITASEVALDESRGFEAGTDEVGVVLSHERPDGIEEQAEYICNTLIPGALERRDARGLGDIAILYLDKNDGGIIANAVQLTGWKYIRVDGNNPYQPSPVTYWLEDCAAWCAGAWKTASVLLSEMVQRWLNFNARLTTQSEKRNALRNLIRFLCENRAPDFPLYEWLCGFLEACLGETLEKEPLLRDDKNKVEKLLRAVSPKGPIEAFTVAFFGGQGGSPDHLTLSTLHSAKGLEYDVVIMIGLEEGRIPSYYDQTEVEIREKRRLFYVGVTRARHEIHLLHSGWYKNSYGREFRNGPSRFVLEIQNASAE